MNDSTFDTLARTTDAPSGRRTAFKVLGVAAMAAMAGAPLTTEARNKKRKRRKKNRNQECPPEKCTTAAQQAAAAICQTQVSPCEARVRQICSQTLTLVENNECEEILLPCCQFLGTCDVDAFFTCVDVED